MRIQNSVFTPENSFNFSPGVLSFLKGDTEQTSEEFNIVGGILKDAKQAWVACGPRLCVVDVNSGSKVSAWDLGSNISNSSTEITHVCELSEPLIPNTKQLLVCLECNVRGGIICIVHCNGSLILRSIRTNSVVIVCVNDFSSIPGGPFSCFDGVLIAGTQNGGVYIIDLNRSCCAKAIKHIHQGYSHLVRDDNNLANLAFLPLDELEHIDEQRQISLENDDHITVHINESSFAEDHKFIFIAPDGTIRLKAKRDHVYVSALLYVPKLASVVVGYNFGAFQIWNLMGVCLEFTSPINVECNPVTHLGFQEPCDDPRAFCYLWAVYSKNDRNYSSGFPIATMHSLTYQGKFLISDKDYIYQDFITCTVRLQLDLSFAESSPELIGGRHIACHTFSIRNSKMSGDGEEGTLNLCQLVWECWSEPNCSTHYGMVLFDLDQWYKDQMPCLESAETSNTYLASSRWQGNDSLDVLLYEAGIYSGAVRREEEHYYPNSLSVRCVSLTSKSVDIIYSPGMQRRLLSLMHSSGPAVLMSSDRLYTSCLSAGLLPLFVNIYGDETSEHQQREFLLSVALESKLITFLERCIVDWSCGAQTAAGCTITFFVEWAWKRALILKKNCSALTASLFDYSNAVMDKNSTDCFQNCTRQLHHLSTLFDKIKQNCQGMLIPDLLHDIDERGKGISMVSTYFRVVEWFIDSGLLPEYTVDSSNTASAYANRLPFPIDELTSYYEKRRAKLHCIKGDQDKSNNDPCDLLYIDQLIEHECGGVTLREVWGGTYPPKSLHSLLNVFLMPGIEQHTRLVLVLYLLLDYSTIFNDDRFECVIIKLMQFPSMFGLSNTDIKTTQAFWHLDHRNFEFALDQLQSLTGSTLLEWQHRTALSALLAQNKTQTALQYLHVRKCKTKKIGADNSTGLQECDKTQDWHSYCDLYLAREMVYEALDVVRIYADMKCTVEDKMETLNYFYKGVNKNGLLWKVIEMPLSPLEEEAFVSYLESNPEQEMKDLLIMYYLISAKYIEAQRVNERLKTTRKPMEMSRGSVESVHGIEVERGEVRSVLLGLISDAMPRVTKTLVKANKIFEQPEFPQIIVPKPISVFVQTSTVKNVTYKSSLMQDAIQHASDMWSERVARGIKRPRDVQETPFLCTPKQAKKMSSVFELPPSASQLDMSVDNETEASPPKKAKTNDVEVKTPENREYDKKLREKLDLEMSVLLEMPDVERVTPWKAGSFREKSREATPHSILKTRRSDRQASDSPTNDAYFDEQIDRASPQQQIDARKHLRFEIPANGTPLANNSNTSIKQPSPIKEPTSASTPSQSRILESPKKLLRDTVRGRLSTSLSDGSINLSNDDFYYSPSESIADLPLSPAGDAQDSISIASIKPRRALHSRSNSATSSPVAVQTSLPSVERKITSNTKRTMRLRTPEPTTVSDLDTSYSLLKNAKIIETIPEIVVSPVRRSTRRLRTPEPTTVSDLDTSYSLLKNAKIIETIPEIVVSPVRRSTRRSSLQAQEVIASSPTTRRNRSKTPEDSTQHEEVKTIAKRTSTPQSEARPIPKLRNKSRSKTPEVQLEKSLESPRKNRRAATPEITGEAELSPVRRSPRSRSKTPEPLATQELQKRTPMTDKPKSRKSLTRMVLEANTFNKTVAKTDLSTTSPSDLNTTSPLNMTAALTELGLSPIVNKSVLKTPDATIMEDTKNEDSTVGLPSPVHSASKIGINIEAWSPISFVDEAKSVLRDCDSNIMEECDQSDVSSENIPNKADENVDISVPALNVSVLKDTIVRSSNENDTSDKKELSSVLTDDDSFSNDVGMDIEKSENSCVILEGEEHENEPTPSEVTNDVSVVAEVVNVSESESDESDNKLQIDLDKEMESGADQQDPLSQDSGTNLGSDVLQTDPLSHESGSTLDPLNDANLSLLTDDDSVLISDQSGMQLNYSSEDVKEAIPEKDVTQQEKASESTVSPVKSAPTPRKRTRSNSSKQSSPGETGSPITRRSTRKKNRSDSESNISIASTQSETERPKRGRKKVEKDAHDQEPKVTSKAKPRRQSTDSVASDSASPRLRSRRAATDDELATDTSAQSEATTRTRRGSSKKSDASKLGVDLDDDSESVASSRSTRSRGQSSDIVAMRRNRRSVSARPELDVIPEVSHEGSQQLELYSTSRRLTRKQRTMLQKSLEPPKSSAVVKRRGSALSDASSEYSIDSEDSPRKDVARHKHLDSKEIKENPDEEENLDSMSVTSKDSVASEFTRKTRARTARTPSETGSTDEPKRLRRKSIDLVSESASPRSSPSTRSRRNKKPLENPLSVDSEASVTDSPKKDEIDGPIALRRTRRVASGQSDTASMTPPKTRQRKTRATSIV